MKEIVYATEVRVCDDLINRIQVTAADIVSGQLLSSGARPYATVRRVFETVVVICVMYQSADKSLPHEHEIISELYSKATFLKMLQTPEFDFFRRKIGIN
jgi:hypothetical protein